jgi:hypothetical protein
MHNTCLFIIKILASFNHHLGPWFEGFTFIKDCTKDPERKSIKTARTSKQYQKVPLARHCELTYSPLRVTGSCSPLRATFTRRCELTYSPWRVGGEQHSRESVLLAMASCLLAVASYDSPDLHKWCF